MLNRKKDSGDIEFKAAWDAGNERAFVTIYDTYWSQLLAIAYRLTQDKEQSEEIVQEVFVSLWRRRHEVKIESVSAYLATAVKFSTFKMMQRTRRQRDLQVEFAPADLHDEEKAIEAKFLKEYLDGVVEELPERCRLVFRMSREQSMSHKEISAELAISEKAVEAQITKALRVLKLSLRKVGFAFVFILFA